MLAAVVPCVAALLAVVAGDYVVEAPLDQHVFVVPDQTSLPPNCYQGSYRNADQSVARCPGFSTYVSVVWTALRVVLSLVVPMAWVDVW